MILLAFALFERCLCHRIPQTNFYLFGRVYTINLVFMINESDTPINFYKVQAHIGVIGNEFADAIAIHAVLHNNGHDEAFPPPSPDGNPFAHIYWLAKENNETAHTTTKISLAPLQNIKDKLKAHMSKHHRLGDMLIPTQVAITIGRDCSPSRNKVCESYNEQFFLEQYKN